MGTKLGVDRDGRPMGNTGGAGFFSIGVPFFLGHSTIAYNGVGVAVAKGTPRRPSPSTRFTPIPASRSTGASTAARFPTTKATASPMRREP